MGAPQPADPPLVGGVCAAWAQPSELPAGVQDLHTEDTWCVILSLASDILWAASGRRWRNVQASETVTLDQPERGCGRDTPWWGRGWWLAGWQPVAVLPGEPHRVRLPRPDVTAITAAVVDGVTLDGGYRRDGNWAVRTDGKGWPAGPGRTEITISFGRLVPAGGRLAAIALAAELGKAWAGKSCALPARVTSVTRQGVTYEALESLEFLKEGLTGLYGVDAWIRQVNPTGARQSGRVWSPDIVEARKL